MSRADDVAKDVVERITDPIERIIADALLGANVPFTSEKGGTHRLDFGLGDGVFVEVKQFYTARADSALQKNENVILIQGRRAAERFASLLRQPEASDFDRDFSALSARALQRGFILRLEPGNE